MKIDRKHILMMAMLFMALVSSCTLREQFEPDPEKDSAEIESGLDGDRISFQVFNASTASQLTKSALPDGSFNRTMMGMMDEDTVYINSSVEENLDLPIEIEEELTKGAPVTSVSDFYVSAYIPNKSSQDYFPYFKNLHVTSLNMTTIEGQDVFQTDYYWPTDALYFHATNYAGDVTYSSATSNTFTYTLPAPNTSTNQDAVDQKDYVFAISPEVYKSDAPVPLTFAHALSAITFKVGAFMQEEGRQVQYVKINNVPSSATCTFGLDANENMVFDWTGHSNVVSYQQNISSSGTETNVANGEVINDGEMTFMLIPHTISEDATIEIAFAMHQTLDAGQQHTIVVSKPIKDLFASGTATEWVAGKKYTYVLSREETIELEISDEFLEANVKGNVTITNNGTAYSYIRAAIVGWWENEAGVVVAPWTSNDGEFTSPAWEATSKWVLAADGFYYYTEPVAPGASTAKLFDKYTVTNSPPSVDSRLILTIATQAVVHYKAEESWFPDLNEGYILNDMEDW